MNTTNYLDQKVISWTSSSSICFICIFLSKVCILNLRFEAKNIKIFCEIFSFPSSSAFHRIECAYCSWTSIYCISLMTVWSQAVLVEVLKTDVVVAEGDWRCRHIHAFCQSIKAWGDITINNRNCSSMTKGRGLGIKGKDTSTQHNWNGVRHMGLRWKLQQQITVL